jgi:acyl dehydratase
VEKLVNTHGIFKEINMAEAKTKAGFKYGTYGLYKASFVRTVQPGATVRQESWKGPMPSNKKSGGTNKYKK